MNLLNDPRQPTTATYGEIIASERREQALTDAYAQGREDERKEWLPVLDALEAVVRQCGSRLTEASGNTALLDHARAVIAKATA